MKGFIERTISSLLEASHYAASAEDLAVGGGALQRVDPRVKLAGLVSLIVVVSASRELRAIALVFAIAVLLALLSNIRIARMFGWVWTPVLFFTGAIALPAIFLTPGHPVGTLGPLLVTEQGIRSAGFLISRAETAATLSTLLVLTTPWPWVLKSLRTFRFPIVLVTILGMTYRYIFVILQTAFEMFESRKSRTVGVLEPRERRRLAAAAVGVLLSKSLQLSGDVHLAMQSRGFRGEVYVMQDFRARAADWYWLAAFTGFAAAGLWWGR
jgi:cobalt/nickel transport system permease protein